MGLDSVWHWLLLLVIVLLVFGAGKLTKLGPELGKAVRGFKDALHGDDDTVASEPVGTAAKAHADLTAAADDSGTKDHGTADSK